MSYTTPPTFVADDPLAAADLNILGDDIAYLKGVADGVGFSGVQLRRTATQSITTATDTLITWQTESGGFDVGSWWASGTDIIVPASAIPAGYTTIACRVDASTRYASNGTGSRILRILVNGTATEGRVTSALSGETTTVDVADFIVVAASDVITVQTYQSSGSTLTIDGASTKVTVVRHAPVA